MTVAVRVKGVNAHIWIAEADSIDAILVLIKSVHHGLMSDLTEDPTDPDAFFRQAVRTFRSRGGVSYKGFIAQTPALEFLILPGDDTMLWVQARQEQKYQGSLLNCQPSNLV